MKKIFKLRNILIFFFGFFIISFISFFILDRLYPLSLERYQQHAQFILDKEDNILRAFTSQDDIWRFNPPQDISPIYLELLLNYEDKHFYQHPGINPFSLIRAGWQWLSNGHIISGGSTLTMQVARLLEPPRPRTINTKIYQIFRAIQLEWHYNKQDILDMYLTLAPFGSNYEGIYAGSWRYFGKAPIALTLAEAALLVALPQSPETLRPDLYSKSALAAREKILQRALDQKIISQQAFIEAIQDPIPQQVFYFPFLAPHLAQSLHQKYPDKKTIKTCIDQELQSQLEKLAYQYIKRFPEKVSLAAVLIDNSTKTIVAYSGSADFFSIEKQGQVDMVQAIRSPGSTLKPFIYGLAFEQNLLHPDTIIEDTPTRFGYYAPRNFSGDYQGAITIRTALQQSLNIPAVKVLDRLGTRHWLSHMKQTGIHFILPKQAKPSLAIALGGLGITLNDLTNLYMSIPNQGIYQKAEILCMENASTSESYALFSEKTSLWLWDILADAPLPEGIFIKKFAYKTGTSYGFRDAWAVGFSKKYTLGIWIGRADGTPNPGYYGRNAAVPFLFEFLLPLGEKAFTLPQFPAPEPAPQALNYFEPLLKDWQRILKSSPPKITFPPDQAKIKLSNLEENILLLEAESGIRPLYWFINGEPITSHPRHRNAFWQIENIGLYQISVVDNKGLSDKITINIY